MAEPKQHWEVKVFKNEYDKDGKITKTANDNFIEYQTDNPSLKIIHVKRLENADLFVVFGEVVEPVGKQSILDQKTNTELKEYQDANPKHIIVDVDLIWNGTLFVVVADGTLPA